MNFSFDTHLNRIAEKAEDNDRLTLDEGMALYKTDDSDALGKLAEAVWRKVNIG